MRKILLMGLPSARKTRLVVSQLEYLPKPIMFYSELAKDVLETMDGSLDETDVILRTPLPDARLTPICLRNFTSLIYG